MPLILQTVDGDPLVTVNDETLSVGDALQRLTYKGFDFTKLSLKLHSIKRKNLQGFIGSNAHFYKCHFSQVSFRDGNLSKSVFQECTLEKVDLTRCQLEGAKFIKTTSIDVNPPIQND